VRLKVLIHKSDASKDTIEYQGAYCMIGRKASNITVSDRRCSQQHLLLFQGPDGKLRAKDLDSTNGTVVNGARVTEAVLSAGDEIKIGQTRLVILSLELPELSGAPIPAVSPVTEPEVYDDTESQIRRVKEDTNPEVIHHWPDNILAQPPSFQAQFIDYVDEKGTMNRILLKDLVKVA
jgi:pSer/pThr/pTyr-binding forkhead associated (FHA) protein